MVIIARDHWRSSRRRNVDSAPLMRLDARGEPKRGEQGTERGLAFLPPAAFPGRLDRGAQVPPEEVVFRGEELEGVRRPDASRQGKGGRGTRSVGGAARRGGG